MFYILQHMSDFIRAVGTPKEWSKFSVKTKNGSVLNLRVVDMPKALSHLVINLYINHFVKDETIYIATGVPKNAEALQELQMLILAAAYADIFHIMICCIDDGDGQIKNIVGASMMSLVSKDDPKLQLDIQSEEIKRVFEILKVLEVYYDEVKAFNLDPCFSDRGLFVCQEYRGLGIAQELLKVRRQICKEHGIPINGAWMTSYGTQKAAERDGWETVCEVPYEELEKHVDVKFGRNPPSSKFMITRIQ